MLHNPRTLAGRVVNELALLVDEGHTMLVVQGFSSQSEQNMPDITVVRCNFPKRQALSVTSALLLYTTVMEGSDIYVM